jgi:hypothetical protein
MTATIKKRHSHTNVIQISAEDDWRRVSPLMARAADEGSRPTHLLADLDKRLKGS